MLTRPLRRAPILAVLAVLAVLAALATASAGCVALIEEAKAADRPPVDTVADVEAAKARGDYAALEGFCMRSGRRDAADAGCAAAVEYLAAIGDVATLRAICDGAKQASPYRAWRDRPAACDAAKRLGSARE
jgi:uncharacterized ParB-like nuclease family protein